MRHFPHLLFSWQQHMPAANEVTARACCAALAQRKNSFIAILSDHNVTLWSH